jgi:hypothetical protein
MRKILLQSWQIYRQNFWVILAVVVVVWTPLELLSSYMDAFVFGEDDIRKSWKFAQFLENFFGIIATAGVIFIGLQAPTNSRATFGTSIAIGFKSWFRMWWTRFLFGLVVVIGLLLLVVPGIYLLVRLFLIEPIVVQERVSGLTAFRRSFTLTEGRFWVLFRTGLTLLFIVIAIACLIVLPTAFIPILDHWLIDAASQLACDVVMAYLAITLTTAYSILKNEQVVEQPVSTL